MAVTTSGTDLFAVMASIRREVVETLRRVVDVIGRYAAAYLPGDARRSVRGFILGLPSRWASLTGRQPTASSSTEPQSPDVEAQKVLTLATESANMLKGVQSIFEQTVDGAERMGRVVGGVPVVSDPFQGTSSSQQGGSSSQQQQQNGHVEERSEPRPKRRRRATADPRGKGKGRAEPEEDGMEVEEEVDGTEERMDEDGGRSSPDRMDVDL